MFADKRMPTLHWYRQERNFGDELSPVVCARYLGGGIALPWGARRQADLLGIGSVVDAALLHEPCAFPKSLSVALRRFFNVRLKRPVRIWGSGLMAPVGRESGRTLFRRAEVFALRGRRTAAELERLGVLSEPVCKAFGDPAILAPEFFPRVVASGRGTAFVPHVSLWTGGGIETFRREHPEIRLIDPRRSPEAVIGDILTCDGIYSSSLHGLIVADAFGVPNAWIRMRHPHLSADDSDFKFLDYYSAFGESRRPFGLSDVSSWRLADPIPTAKLDAARSALIEAAGRLVARMKEGE